MDIIVQLNNQTAGRDRIMRLLQYGARVGWYYCRNDGRSRHSTDVLKSLEYTLSSFRKLLQFGRCLDSFYSALKAMKHPADPAIRIITSMSRMTNAFFLYADHMIWLSRAGLMRLDLEKWTRVSHRYWLTSIILSLTRDVYEILKIWRRRGAEERFPPKDEIAERKDVILDTIKNSCDLPLPLSALGYAELSPGAVGLFGACSSAIGLYCLARPRL